MIRDGNPFGFNGLTFSVYLLETPKWVFWQILKAFHKGLYTVCKDINTFQGLNILINNLDSYLTCDPLVLTNEASYAHCIKQMEEFISQRVNAQVQINTIFERKIDNIFLLISF